MRLKLTPMVESQVWDILRNPKKRRSIRVSGADVFISSIIEFWWYSSKGNQNAKEDEDKENKVKSGPEWSAVFDTTLAERIIQVVTHL